MSYTRGGYRGEQATSRGGASSEAFKRLMMEYEKVHAEIVHRREETKRLNVRYNELKVQVLRALQDRQQLNPQAPVLTFKGHDGERYKLKAAESVSKVRIGQRMLKSNLERYQQRYPQYRHALEGFYHFLEEQCKQGGRQTQKLSRTKMRRKARQQRDQTARPPAHRRLSAPMPSASGYRTGTLGLEEDMDITPEMKRMLSRVQSARRLRDTDQHSM